MQKLSELTMAKPEAAVQAGTSKSPTKRGDRNVEKKMRSIRNILEIWKGDLWKLKI